MGMAGDVCKCLGVGDECCWVFGRERLGDGSISREQEKVASTVSLQGAVVVQCLYEHFARGLVGASRRYAQRRVHRRTGKNYVDLLGDGLGLGCGQAVAWFWP